MRPAAWWSGCWPAVAVAAAHPPLLEAWLACCSLPCTALGCTPSQRCCGRLWWTTLLPPSPPSSSLPTLLSSTPTTAPSLPSSPGSEWLPAPCRLLWPQRQSQLQSQLPAPAPVPVPAPAPALAAAALPPPHGPCCSQSSSSSSVSGLAGSGGPLPWTLQLRLPALLLPELQPQAEFSSCLCSLCLLSSRARPQSLHSWASRPLRALP